MYEPASVKCNICGVRHGKNNGWVVIHSTKKSVVLSGYSVSAAKKHDVVCGEGCLHKYISQLGGVFGTTSKQGE
jgi:hypothetical protein